MAANTLDWVRTSFVPLGFLLLMLASLTSAAPDMANSPVRFPTTTSLDTSTPMTTPPSTDWITPIKTKATLTDITTLATLLLLLVLLWKYRGRAVTFFKYLCCCCCCRCPSILGNSGQTALRLVVSYPGKEMAIVLWRTDMCPADMELLGQRPTGISVRGHIYPTVYIGGLAPVVKPKFAGLARISIPTAVHLSPWRAFILRRMIHKTFSCHYEWFHKGYVYKIVLGSDDVDAHEWEENVNFLRDDASVFNDSIVII